MANDFANVVCKIQLHSLNLRVYFLLLMSAAIGINFPFIQNENVTLISDVCTEGERSRAVNALNRLGLLVYQASQGLVLVQSADS